MDKRITVVLADANEEFRTALKQALEATGEFDVVGCAADGLAAAQDIAERKPQLLVMDLLLPGLDGFGVLEQAAKDCGVSAQREILLCGGTDTSALQKARAGVQAGAVSIPTRYIHSPSELCAVSDVEDAAKLLAQYALRK